MCSAIVSLCLSNKTSFTLSQLALFAFCWNENGKFPDILKTYRFGGSCKDLTLI